MTMIIAAKLALELPGKRLANNGHTTNHIVQQSARNAKGANNNEIAGAYHHASTGVLAYE